MSGWTKLFSSIVTSTVWCEDHATVRVWVAMLATADAEGLVEGSIPGFANLARVSVDEMRAAVQKLSSVDPDSRTPDHEGRRIEAIEGGWRILNYAAYRSRGQEKEGSRAPAMRRYRARKRDMDRNALPRDVTRYPEERGERQEAENGHNGLLPAPAGRSDAQPSNGNGHGHGSVTERERARLEADPVLARLADGWAKAMERPGREIGVLRAARAAVAGGYDPASLILVARVVAAAKRAPERFPERGSIRWAVEHAKTGAAYLWRSDTLDRLIPEAQAWEAA